MRTTLRIKENVALAPLTTLGIGGKARFFAAVRAENEVLEAVNFARERDLPLFVLGGGSNLVVADEGFAGLVLRMRLTGIEFTEKSGAGFVSACAGENWDELVRICVRKDLQGIECLSGIPGTVGGTPIQNVGAYGQEVSQTIENVRVLHRETGEISEISNAACQFAYRQSIFNTTHKDQFIILRVTYRLPLFGEPQINYKDLKKFFAHWAEKPNLEDVRQAVWKIRAMKSMVLDENDVNSRSVGSFFKNPVVCLEKFNKIEKAVYSAKLINVNENVPNFPVSNNLVKIPAAWLIQKCGFEKGTIRGNVGLSANHPLAIINRGGAAAREIIDLANEIKSEVRKVFAIELQPEPIFLGFSHL